MLKVKPIFFDKIWGGDLISKEFNQNSNKLGEAWIISGYDQKGSEIINGEYSGKTLDNLYKERKELFGNYKTDDFPLLIKLIHAKDDLSIQVHPDDKYAQEVEKVPFGKYESWHILEAPKGTEIVVGHNFEDEDDVQSSYDWQLWEDKWGIKKISKGDTFDITPGTVHAICKNTYLYEIQQSCDVTYRLYDYNRLENGKPRDLHIHKSKQTIDYEKKTVSKVTPTKLVKNVNGSLSELIDNPYFKLHKLELIKELEISNFYKEAPFMLVTCIEGQGLINKELIMKNESVILTTKELAYINTEGNMTLLIGYPK